MKIAVYTFITKGYDTLRIYDPEFLKEADFFIFTDAFDSQLINVGFYKPLKIKFKGQNDRFVSRYYKINAHLFFGKYDYIIYLDGTTSMNISPTQLIEKYLSDADLAAFRYPDEDCTYIHAEKCKIALRHNDKLVDRHMEFYHSEAFPEHFGFSEVRVVLRKNTLQIKEFNKLWWNTFEKYLTCDQLCFDYCVWKMGIKRNSIPFYYPWDEGEHEFSTLQNHNFSYPHVYDL